MDVKTMTVADVIKNISNQQLKVKDLAEVFGKSDRTVQAKIKALGYRWDAKEAVYKPIGDSYSPENDSKMFAELFEASPIKKAVKASQEVKKARKEVATTKENDTVKKGKVSFDTIDNILFGDQKARVQRAYYIDKDLAEIIDRVEGKQKSNLVNECIRKVFKEKGIL
jgi:hypothetical protein